MVKPLTFKGDKKVKKRKRADGDDRALTQAKNLSSTQSADHDDQNWVSADVPSDISGPVVIVLPSTPPTCIACDVNGKVFASEIENMIEGDPSTAEPHDVRQVWVATKVAGSEGFNFKGHHGRYLSCDKYGILNATSSAISALESLIPISSVESPGLFSFQTCGGDKDAFLAIKENTTSSNSVEIRGDAENASFNSSFRVRMQAQFKPKLRASKESKALEKVSRKELEATVGRRLEDHEVKRLKRARKEGHYHEEILDLRVKGKHDKFAS
ncbi:hypothetical protein LOZ53_003120 [Ophidiomyces ophidiicola]|nr:hypothetical protein LOZ54_006153 [Ophidiomyces ophidiicola]KAI1980690.1 hypothetical protein LOZ55_001265 [Ophidiomyces ophidiicola]KAI1990814.1 hypothetical protein LOZ53_003120 [Ophidiomyces ophidiicola]KAI1999417.1 hypothetical protein LOZ51_001904 [Ophidiomyces ophidiicola]